ncbi:MAG: thiamine-monophosphate kinase [Candidatus Spyradosoma sp.]
MNASARNPNFPFADDAGAGSTVGALGETALLREIAARLAAFPRVSRPAPRGIGDDCAVFPNEHGNARRLTTADSVIFSRHFDESVSARDAGAKLIRRNVSDVAAMGGEPADAVISLIMSRDVRAAWLAEFYEGAARACDALGVELAGGDVASAPAGTRLFAATLALTGFCAGEPLTRTGARVGDAVCVTGTLGGSLRRKHYAFEPRVREGAFLAAFPRDRVRACIDVTDGAAKDLPAIVPAGAHAEIDFAAVPVSADALALSGGDADAALRRAFCDGEDYELLFCVAPDFEAELFARWRERFPETPLTRIGRIAAGAPAGPLFSGGYEHFAPEK